MEEQTDVRTEGRNGWDRCDVEADEWTDARMNGCANRWNTNVCAL